jgi:hypothetical protein
MRNWPKEIVDLFYRTCRLEKFVELLLNASPEQVKFLFQAKIEEINSKSLDETKNKFSDPVVKKIEQEEKKND